MDDDARATVTRGQVLGVTLGNALEFYDFLIFTFFAVQIGHSFFPATDPASSLLAALATFGAGFLTRPLGAFVIGGLGDRIGRRPMMILSFALIGCASLGVALTPPYATIGYAAPVIVIALRLVQGFALGGEMGASTAFLVEAAPVARRGLYVSFQYAGQNASTLVAGLVGVGLAASMDDAALSAWGWRVAMAIGVLILPLGLMLRGSLPETLHPDVSAQPVPHWSSYGRVAVLAFFILLATTVTTYVLNYMTTYAKTVLHLSSGVAFGATVMVGIAGVIGALAAGLLSDRYGRRPVMVWPMLVACVAIVPGFWLVLHVPGAGSLYAVSLVLRLAIAMGATAGLVAITEGFPPRVRSGALAVVYAVAISVFGGSTQFVIAWLIQVTGDPLAPAWYMLAAALLGLGASILSRETAPRSA